MNQNFYRPLFFTFFLLLSVGSYAVERNFQQNANFNSEGWILFADDDQHALMNQNGHWEIAVRGPNGVENVIDLGHRTAAHDATSGEKNSFIVEKLIKTGFLKLNTLAKLYEQSLNSTMLSQKTKLMVTEENASKNLNEQKNQDNQLKLVRTEGQFLIASGEPDDDYDPSSSTILIELPKNNRKRLKNNDDNQKNSEKTSENIIEDVIENQNTILEDSNESLEDFFDQIKSGRTYQFHERQQEKKEEEKEKEKKRKKKKKKKRIEKERKKKEMQKKHPIDIDALYYDYDGGILDSEEHNKRLQKLRQNDPNAFNITPEMVDDFIPIGGWRELMTDKSFYLGSTIKNQNISLGNSNKSFEDFSNQIQSRGKYKFIENQNTSLEDLKNKIFEKLFNQIEQEKEKEKEKK